jgi:hypothetical protein
MPVGGQTDGNARKRQHSARTIGKTGFSTAFSTVVEILGKLPNSFDP